MIDFKRKLSEELHPHIDLNQEEILTAVEIPKNSEMGDFAFPCFRLAKTFRKAPNVIAQELAEKIQLSKAFSKVEVVGGYLNFFVNRNYFAMEILKTVYEEKDQYGGDKGGEGKVICIDYSAPNVAKPFHVGHLRSTVIGNSLYRIYEFLGYKCVGINHLGDWGTQFGKVIVAYRNWGDKEALEKEPINTLLALYVKFHDEAEKNPALEDEARSWFTRMEKGDEEALSLWQWFSSETIKELKKIYGLLDVEFDHYTGESYYNDKMDTILKELHEKNLLKESQGATLVDLSEYDMPPCLMQKKDGSTLYATRDVTAAVYRKNTYHFHKCLYVTDYSQNLHFAQWFKVIELMGYPWSQDIVHIPFGRVSHEGRRIQTRKGSVVLLEEVLSGAVERVKEIIEEKNPSLENKEEVAMEIGIGAVIFNDLSNNRIKDISFSWETAFSFEGETGPYVQYTHARASSVLRRSDVEVTMEFDPSVLADDVSMTVLKEIQQFPEVILDAQRKNEPSIITRHIIDIAQAFNRFYHDHPILVEDEQVKKARLAVVFAVKQVLKNGLYLLGIKAPEKM